MPEPGEGGGTPLDFITQASPPIRVDAREIKDEIARRWHMTLARDAAGAGAVGARTGRGMSVSGSTPPSVFVGSYGYPKVYVGPMVPPVHGDTAIFDSPERWRGLSLGDIVGLRLGMIRGVRQVRADLAGSGGDGRYVERLQEVAMASDSIGSDISFEGPVQIRTARRGGHSGGDDTGTPFGPIGLVRSAEFSDVPRPSKQIERLYYDTDASASEAMFSLYESGVAMSDIQRCLSIGMLGSRRRLVPTKWSITAADSAISSRLLGHVSECDVVDSCRVFCHEHLGNAFAVVLFENRWLFELVEAWHAPAPDGGNNTAPRAPGRTSFASDWETSHLQRAPQNTAGAYYAARLGVLEYLAEKHVQAGALVMREIRPEYSVPVGVWQVREGVRAAMKNPVAVADSMADGVRLAASATGIAAPDWLGHADTTRLARQRTLGDYA